MIDRVLPAWAIAVTGVVFGALLGAAVTGAIKGAELGTLHQQHAEQRAAADRDALARLQAATQRGDRLTLDLHTQLIVNAALKDQIDAEIATITHGRPCLDPAALRLLDRAAQPAAVPAAPRRAAAAGAAQPAAHPPQPAPDAARRGVEQPAASDTDVTRWAADAYTRYAECAARLGALIDWHSAPQSKDARP